MFYTMVVSEHEQDHSALPLFQNYSKECKAEIFGGFTPHPLYNNVGFIGCRELKFQDKALPLPPLHKTLVLLGVSQWIKLVVFVITLLSQGEEFI